ncbi:hypothetical protein MesoLjLc_39520 [Mesorhizobium sp. L-8-10]|uniref:beta strand repeat-containing protein n=1 Tax=Mesorhizobium sp. L-8-10 TaxID=2744523 RepID=UPI001928CD11|nr:calcium-binding protein [Mesorhizobium sp. L-8-10]BCH32022.1 hypothetical protein MesoLjLc_39520 [Mesorhizobium sp. L-8-10]
MATFTGTTGDDTITPGLVTSGVVVVPAGTKPSNANDIINAGAGADTIDSGGGNDTVAGQQGNDIIRLGDGNDTALWNPGDGSDTIDGGAGFDTLDFFASNASEIVALSSNAGHLRLSRDVGSVTLDVDAMEKVVFHAFGGTDSITVGDLSGTDVTQVVINLEGVLGSGSGDAVADIVVFNGTDTSNSITISGVGGSIAIAGLPWTAAVSAADAFDRLVVNGGGGNDTISAAGLGTTLASLTIDAGLGNDTVIGSAATDVLLGSAGNDVVTGSAGNDIIFLGAGSDRAIWNPGDGSDTIEGQGQTDTLEFNGSAATENFTLSANGGRARLFRDVAAVTMDLDDVELLVLNAGSGSNSLQVGNMTGTDLVGSIVYVGGSQVDTVDASAAFNDMIVTGGGGADSLIGGNGDDYFRYFSGADAASGEVVLGAGGVNDTIQLFNTGAIGFSAVTLSGLERLQFASGNSSVTFKGDQIGGSGIERVTGGAGSDAVIVKGNLLDLSTVLFSGWNDATDRITLFGTADVSHLTGSVRNDVIHGGGGADRMAGEAGNDVYYVDNIGDRTIEEAGGGTDTVYSAVNYVLASGQHIETLATTLLAGTGAIHLTGNELGQRINGNNGNNGLNGLAGNDVLAGYGGHDWLKGGAGNDTLAGGAGFDNFVFDTALNAATNVDRITDFNVTADTIRLDNAVMPGLGATLGTLAAAKFWKSTTGLAHDADDRIIYETDTGKLFYDANGNGSGGAVHFATLAPNLALTNADFVVF